MRCYVRVPFDCSKLCGVIVLARSRSLNSLARCNKNIHVSGRYRKATDEKRAAHFYTYQAAADRYSTSVKHDYQVNNHRMKPQ